MTIREIRIGSRGSALALAQATLVRDRLTENGHPAAIVIIETEGDRRAPDTAWGEGAFVAAIERALLDDRVDIAVHSAKDIPTDEDPRLRIAAFLPRADARDALVVRDGQPQRQIDELPIGTRVGTDSPRRTGFLRARRPDLLFHPLHGNVDTRLRRLDQGETDALILACAGLDRLRLGSRIAERLDPEIVPPAPGQGAIAIQVRSSDRALLTVCDSIDDRATRVAVEAERAFLRASGGGCRAPIGAYGQLVGEAVEVLGGHARPDGSEIVFGRQRGSAEAPAEVGRRLAAELDVRDRLVVDAHEVDGDGGVDGSRRRRVIVTRAATDAGELMHGLRREALEPLLVPAIEIEFAGMASAVDDAARSFQTSDWVVVTSGNGARAILGAIQRVPAEIGIPRWAAIGDATRDVLERAGISVSFQPTPANATAMAMTLPIDAGDRVVVLRADLADGRVAAALRDRGAVVDDVVAYETRQAPAGSKRLLRAAHDAGPIDAIVFTSGSTVRGLCAIAAREAIDIVRIPAVCIGTETADVASAAGFRVIAVAPTPDAAALARTAAAALAPQLQETR